MLSYIAVLFSFYVAVSFIFPIVKELVLIDIKMELKGTLLLLTSSPRYKVGTYCHIGGTQAEGNLEDCVPNFFGKLVFTIYYSQCIFFGKLVKNVKLA